MKNLNRALLPLLFSLFISLPVNAEVETKDYQSTGDVKYSFSYPGDWELTVEDGSPIVGPTDSEQTFVGFTTGENMSTESITSALKQMLMMMGETDAEVQPAELAGKSGAQSLISKDGQYGRFVMISLPNTRHILSIMIVGNEPIPPLEELTNDGPFGVVLRSFRFSEP